jgi:Domain of unknown function (DUF5063)
LDSSPLTSPEALAFQVVAERYCRLLDQRREFDGRELMARAHELLPELYQAALRLPIVKPSGDIEDDDEESDDERWWRVRDDLVELLGSADLYLGVYDPIESKGQALSWSLGEDLANIYRSLKEGLDSVPQRGVVSPVDVLWAWRFHWEHNWGRHALGALQALHAQLTGYYARPPAERSAPEA